MCRIVFLSKKNASYLAALTTQERRQVTIANATATIAYAIQTIVNVDSRVPTIVNAKATTANAVIL